MSNPSDSLAPVFKALSEPPRLEILALLRHGGEMCVCDVEAVLGLTQSRASRHLGVLARAGFVEGLRAGAWVHYRVLPEPDPLVRAMLLVLESAFSEERLAELMARLEAVRTAKAQGSACVSPFRDRGVEP
ncbi:MAG: helix-turn-helix transcriptional regulator [Deltaproteobacteria bacterium]|nr:helix-turn-helix transcriptional regulator [Deltaproteobacteria bacterium]